MRLGRLGAWYPTDRLAPDELARLLAAVEDMGYGTFWYPEAAGYEAFSLASFMLARTTRLGIGSSIANIYARDAVTARQGMLGMMRMYDGRFVLGLGVSHAVMVEGRGHRYAPPVPAMRAYLDRMQQDQEGSADWPVMLAALGPLMLRLAGERTKGALPANSTPEHTRRARAAMPAGAQLAVEQKFLIETDAGRARALGRAEIARFVGMPNYRSHWLRIGFTEADLGGGGSDRFIDAMFNWGSVETVKRGIQAQFDAGATHVCVRPLHAAGDFATRDAMWKAVADA